MAFVSLNAGTRRVGRAKGSGHPAPLTATTTPGKRGPDGKLWQNDRAVFRLVEKLWTEAGWSRGQRVEVLFDRERMLAVMKASDTGYTLTSNGAEFHLIVLIPFTEDSGFPRFTVQTGMEDVAVKKDGIHFRVPQPAQSANGHANGATEKPKRRA
jgi:hypothetical protein